MKAIILYDDIDVITGQGNNEADESVSFGLDGQAFSIDLTDAHAKQLREALAPFIGAAERIDAMPKPPRPRSNRAAGHLGPAATTNAGIKAFCEDPANEVPWEEWHTLPTGKVWYKKAARQRYAAYLAGEEAKAG